MRFLLITVGSRGDGEPFCALAKELTKRGHNVDIFIMKDTAHLATGAASDIAVHELPFTQTDFYRVAANPTHGTDHENQRVRFIGIVADVIGDLVLPCVDDVLEVAQSKESQVIVTSSLSRQLSMAVGEKLNIPVAVVHLQPLLPTKMFPHYSDDEASLSALDERVAKEEYMENYFFLEQFYVEFLRERLDKMHMKLGLDPPKFDDNFKNALLGANDNTWIVNAFSNELVPFDLYGESPYNILNVGPLADDFMPHDWTAPEHLLKFLKECGEDPPVCVGFGSMPFDKARNVFEALKSLNQKAIVVGNAAQAAFESVEDDEWAKDNICRVSSAPYPWLLPQCSIMLCHGGAGVVNATLRAGIPCVVAPLMGDQFFWAKLLEKKNLGAKAGQVLSGLTMEEIRDAIVKANACKKAARSVGETIRCGEAGVSVLVRELEKRL